MQRNKSTKSQKLILLVLIIIMMILLGIISLSKNTSDKMLQKVSKTSEIDFMTIYNKYKENESNANDKYINEDFILNVTITEIKESNGKPYIVIKEEGYICEIYFFKNQKEKISELKEGDKIKCIAKVDEIGGLFATVTFKDAVII